MRSPKQPVNLDDPKLIAGKLNRYHKVAIAAVKQCRRSYLPEITAPRTFKDFMKEIDHTVPNLLFDPRPNAKKLTDIEFPKSVRRVTVLVGPEAGFSQDELALADIHNITIITLGNRILRTETAGPVITALVMHRLGELS